MRELHLFAARKETPKTFIQGLNASNPVLSLREVRATHSRFSFTRQSAIHRSPRSRRSSKNRSWLPMCAPRSATSTPRRPPPVSSSRSAGISAPRLRRPARRTIARRRCRTSPEWRGAIYQSASLPPSGGCRLRRRWRLLWRPRWAQGVKAACGNEVKNIMHLPF